MIKNRRVKYVIMDMEWTCWGSSDKRPHNLLREIISIGALKVDEDFNTIDTFYSTVKPTVNSTLSSYCINLTGLAQKEIDNSKGFAEVFSLLEGWINKNPEFENICFWGNKDEKVIKAQAKYLGYSGNLLKWINKGKVIDVQPIILADIRSKLNIHMNISLNGTKVFYGIKTPVTHNPLNDADDVRQLWKLKNNHNGIFDKGLLECARHMNVLNELASKVVFIGRETAWISIPRISKKKDELISESIARDFNFVKAVLVCKFASDVSSPNVTSFDYVEDCDDNTESNIINIVDAQNFDTNDVLEFDLELDFDTHDVLDFDNTLLDTEYTSKQNSLTTYLDRSSDIPREWKHKIVVKNVGQKIPKKFLTTRGINIYKSLAPYITNGLKPKEYLISEDYLNVTLGKIACVNGSLTQSMYNIVLILNGVIIFLEPTEQNEKAYRVFMDGMKKLSAHSYPLQ